MRELCSIDYIIIVHMLVMLPCGFLPSAKPTQPKPRSRSKWYTKFAWYLLLRQNELTFFRTHANKTYVTLLLILCVISSIDNAPHAVLWLYKSIVFIAKKCYQHCSLNWTNVHLTQTLHNLDMVEQVFRGTFFIPPIRLGVEWKCI